MCSSTYALLHCCCGAEVKWQIVYLEISLVLVNFCLMFLFVPLTEFEVLVNFCRCFSLAVILSKLTLTVSYVSFASCYHYVQTGLVRECSNLKPSLSDVLYTKFDSDFGVLDPFVS